MKRVGLGFWDRCSAGVRDIRPARAIADTSLNEQNPGDPSFGSQCQTGSQTPSNVMEQRVLPLPSIQSGEVAR